MEFPESPERGFTEFTVKTESKGGGKAQKRRYVLIFSLARFLFPWFPQN
jgi:hypothetical protein